MLTVALPCPKLDDLENGTVMVDSHHVGSTARYRCAKRFKLVGPRVRRCLPTALWGGTTPVCVPKDPPSMIICQHTTTKYNKKAIVIHYVHIILYTQVHYTTVTVYLICSLFISVIPAGETPELLCPELNDPRWGTVKISFSADIVAYQAVYKCERGRSLNGDKRRYCSTKTKMWSGQEPTCIPGTYAYCIFWIE